MSEKPDFAALRAKRDEGIEAIVSAICDDMGCDRSEVLVRTSPYGCYCACPTGPCEHQFSAWRTFTSKFSSGGETVCTLCGQGAMSHDLRTAE